MDQVTDAEIQGVVDDATAQIDNICDQFFEPRAMTIELDGSGSTILPIPFPIARIDVILVRIGHPEDPVTIQPTSVEDVVVYNRHLTQGLVTSEEDDRRDPKIVIEPSSARRWHDGHVTGHGHHGHHFHGADRARTRLIGVWPKGDRNVSLEGVFGFTEPDLANLVAEGVTPRLIKKAARLMVARELAAIGAGPEDRGDLTQPWAISKIKTVDQEVAFGFRGGGANAHQFVGAFTGIPEVDNILVTFIKPPDLRFV